MHAYIHTVYDGKRLKPYSLIHYLCFTFLLLTSVKCQEHGHHCDAMQ